MSDIKIAKQIDFYVNIKYKKDGDKLHQIFEFNVTNKKYLAYAYDSRYLLKRKIDKLIKDEFVENFIERIDEKEYIEVIYETEKTKRPKIVNLNFYLPPFNGCKYCEKCEKQGNFLYCIEKNKHYDLAGIKNCKVFKSVEEIIT
jgi:hypothetical protein